MKKQNKPLILLILDGWGHREEPLHNAIYQANTPNWDQLWQQYPHTLISGSGRAVGLPDGQMGNSEVGHMNLGAGRVVHQAISRIDKSINDGDFYKNEALLNLCRQCKENDRALHLLALLSDGGVHSHQQHIHAMISLAARTGVQRVYCHAFLDGRDTLPKSALPFLQALTAHCKKEQCGEIASIIGRYYAMDRDNRWDRVELAYNLLTQGTFEFSASSVEQAIEAAYQRGETDEFVKATVIGDKNSAKTIQAGDGVVMMNFRADRARQLCYALNQDDFSGFQRQLFPKINLTTLTTYDKNLKVPVAFPSENLSNVLGDYVAQKGLKQLRIAETEKYAHVTFFFNGGREQPFQNEERILIPSPKVATYDLQPEMHAPEMTDALINAINEDDFDLIIGNFANPDMVGHTGNMAATIKAIETIDTCIGRIHQALQAKGGELVITADHGNAELLYNEEKAQAHTAHTQSLVPCLYIGRKAELTQQEPGALADIAPSLLHLLDLPAPKEMTGNILFKLID